VVTKTKKPTREPEALVPETTNPATKCRQKEGANRQEMANSAKKSRPKEVVKRRGTANTTTRSRKNNVVTKRDKTNYAAKGEQRVVVKANRNTNGTKTRLVTTSGKKVSAKSTTRTNYSQTRTAVFGLRKDGPDMRRMFYGKKPVKQDEGKSLTTLEGLIFLNKLDKNQVGKEELSIRSSLLDMGLAVTAPDDGEIKSRRERIEEVCGSGRGVWKTYEDNSGAIEEDLRAAAACVVLVATMERGEEGTLDEVTFVDENGNRVEQERTLMFSTMCLNEAADMLSRGLGDCLPSP
jgi:hypothetical protein